MAVYVCIPDVYYNYAQDLISLKYSNVPTLQVIVDTMIQ